MRLLPKRRVHDYLSILFYFVNSPPCNVWNGLQKKMTEKLTVPYVTYRSIRLVDTIRKKQFVDKAWKRWNDIVP